MERSPLGKTLLFFEEVGRKVTGIDILSGQVDDIQIPQKKERARLFAQNLLLPSYTRRDFLREELGRRIPLADAVIEGNVYSALASDLTGWILTAAAIKFWGIEPALGIKGLYNLYVTTLSIPLRNHLLNDRPPRR